MRIIPNYDLSGNAFDPNGVSVVDRRNLGPVAQLSAAAVGGYMHQVGVSLDRGVVDPGEQVDLFAEGYTPDGLVLYCNLGRGAAAVINPDVVQTDDKRVYRAITVAVDDPNRGAITGERGLAGLIRNLVSPF